MLEGVNKCLLYLFRYFNGFSMLEGVIIFLTGVRNISTSNRMIPALGLSNNALTLLFLGARAVSFFTSCR
jgi:hypothetical protein